MRNRTTATSGSGANQKMVHVAGTSRPASLQKRALLLLPRALPMRGRRAMACGHSGRRRTLSWFQAPVALKSVVRLLRAREAVPMAPRQLQLRASRLLRLASLRRRSRPQFRWRL